MVRAAEPRLVDVADRAGVSVATVSRVLNDRGYLSDQTRAKVQAAIDELGYRPNLVARSLLSKRTGTVGLIVPSVALPFYGEVAVGVENALAERGFRLLLCNSYGRSDRELELLDLLVANRVDGIISGAHNDPLPHYAALSQPVVTIDRELAPHIPNVRAQNQAGGELATTELLRHGCRRPALLTSRSHERNLRERGYRRILESAGIEPVVVAADFNTPEPERTLQVHAALDAVAPLVDGVFATDDLLAARALEWARIAGISVPGDLRLIGFDGTSTMRMALPGLTTVEQPINDICVTAVALLLDQVKEREAGAPPRTDPVEAIELPVRLVRGNTS